MSNNLDQRLEAIEQSSQAWRSLAYYDRLLLKELETCLQLCLAVSSDESFLGLVMYRRPLAVDMFEYAAAFLLKNWSQYPRSLTVEQLNYLSAVGVFNRRLSLTLQNDNDVIELDEEQTAANLGHQQRVRQILFESDSELFNILMSLLPTISEHELDFIAMILPWYESYIYFEHSYVDSSLADRFLLFNRQIIQCLKSEQYERTLLLVETSPRMITTVRHRFFLGMCTMAMGVHVNCDDNECDEAKHLLESYLSRYIAFVHAYLTQEQDQPSNSLVCVTGIVTFLANYILIIDNDNKQQLLDDLFAITLQESYYSCLRINWSTYETILLDSIICYLIIYCFNHRSIARQILRGHHDYLDHYEKLIEQAQAFGNRRIAIMSQLLLLILTSCAKNEPLAERLFLACLTYIQMSLDNDHSYHYNRIPMSMFFKSVTHVVQQEHVQKIILSAHTNLFIDMILNYERSSLCDNAVYRECAMITVHILWSLSFNERIKSVLKQGEQRFFDIVQRLNVTTTDMPIKQSTCGLLYNLDRLNLVTVSCMASIVMTHDDECFMFFQNALSSAHNFGKIIGISHDPSDRDTVQMIEQELNKVGYRVWTTYDHMHDHFVPSFIACMHDTQYLIVCLSDTYRFSNRCRTELLYATSSGHRVLSWKVHESTTNEDDAVQTRHCGIETLLERISADDGSQGLRLSIGMSDTSYTRINTDSRSMPAGCKRRRRTKDAMPLDNWSNADVLAWCRSRNLTGFAQLLIDFDGQSIVKLYEFCKHNSAETISLLNRDLQHAHEPDSLANAEISVHEFIRFQIEVEKLLALSSFSRSTSTLLRTYSPSLSSSKFNIYHKKHDKVQLCSIL